MGSGYFDINVADNGAAVAYGNPLHGDFTGFTFNGHHSSEFRLLRVSKSKRYGDIFVPPLKDTTAEVPGGVGEYYFGETIQKRDFSIEYAYDGISELDIRRIKQWLHPDEQLHELIFDERPYVKYWVKCSKEVKNSFICFDEDGERVYKGDGDWVFTAYFPYGVDNGKFVEDYADCGNVDEWIDSSGMITRANANAIWLNTFYDNKFVIFNPGDTATGFKLKFQKREYCETFYISGGSSSTTTIDIKLLQWDSEIEENIQDLSIYIDGFKFGANSGATKERIDFYKGDRHLIGNIITTNQPYFIDEDTNEIYDLYTPKEQSYNISCSGPLGLLEGYKFYVYQSGQEFQAQVTQTVPGTTTYGLSFDPNNHPSIQGGNLTSCKLNDSFFNITLKNQNNIISSMQLVAKSAATISQKNWNLIQNMMFNSSVEITIDTDKKTIECEMNGQMYGLAEWLKEGTLFKIPPTWEIGQHPITDDWGIELAGDFITCIVDLSAAIRPTISYNYLYI